MWLKVSNLLCSIPYLYKKYLVLQGGVLSACLLGCIHVMAQVLSERVAFRGVKGGVLFHSPTYLELALDMGVAHAPMIVQ